MNNPNVNINELLENGIAKIIPIVTDYAITKDGTIYRVKSAHRTFPGRLVHPHVGKDGYVRATLSLNGQTHTYTVHRLVMMTWEPTDDMTKDVDHIDGNKQNNDLSNLRWCTHQENCKYRFASDKVVKDDKLGIVAKKGRPQTSDKPEKQKKIKKTPEIRRLIKEKGLLWAYEHGYIQ